VPVGSRIDPFCVGGMQHLDAVPELTGDESWIHAIHQANRGVGVAAVVLTTHTHAECFQGVHEVAVRHMGGGEEAGATGRLENVRRFCVDLNELGFAFFAIP
jgi:hypothetical protein